MDILIVIEAVVAVLAMVVFLYAFLVSLDRFGR